MTFSRDIQLDEVVPQGWIPSQLPTQSDGNLSILTDEQSKCELFAHLSIWTRCSDGHWFSFIFLSGEACAVFQGLYLRLRIIPAVICLIQPGEAFGGNWTNFFDSNGFFHRTVCEVGLPPHLLTGGSHGKQYFSNPCWPGYSLVAKPQPTFIPADNFLGRIHPIGNGKVLRLWRLDQ